VVDEVSADLIAATRVDFGCFFELAFNVLHPGKKLIYADYLDLLITVMEHASNGLISRLIVNLPPGYMKSMLISVMYVAWRLGVDPTRKIACISYGDALIVQHSTSTRRLMLSDMYRAVFPNTLLTTKNENTLRTTVGGMRYAVGVGGQITGFRPNEIILDDPIEPDDALSEPKKEAIRSWLSNEVMTRFEDNDRNLFVLVMHRVAPDDISGTLAATGDYQHILLPLVAETDECFSEEGGPVIFERGSGEFLNPGRMNAEQLEVLKKSISPHAFDSQYQQRPKFGDSGMCTINRLFRYKKLPPHFEFKIHSWDIGATTTGNASVCTKWGIARVPSGHYVFYLMDVVSIKKELPDVEAAIKMHDKLDKPAAIVLDHRGVGLGIHQRLRSAGWRHVYEPGKKGETTEGKIDRFGRALLYMYDGLVQFPESGPFVETLLYALASFPDSKELDLVDSITQVIAHYPEALRYAKYDRRPDWL
jgi:hypothetical protein